MKSGNYSKHYQLTPMAAAVTMALAVLSQNVTAADEPATPGLETVIVSANKRIEKLENIPMSIQVLGEELLERTNVRDFDDVMDLTPALTRTQSDNPANTGFNMRGIGTQSIGVGVESDVVTIIDEIPMGMQVQAFRELADVIRVEVLKGPQSTLQGKAAIAGAINVVTRPISGPITTKGGFSITDDGEWRLRAAVGGNVSDKFGFRISANKSDFPGNVNNLTTGGKTNGNAGKTFMAKFSWHPTENLDIDFFPRYNYSVNACCVLVPNGVTGTGGLLNNVAAFPQSLVFKGYDPTNRYNNSVRNDSFTGQTSSDRGAGLKFAYALKNGATVTSISSVDKYHANDSRDQDFTDLPVMLYYKVTGVIDPVTKTQALAGINAGSEQHGITSLSSRTEELRYNSPDGDSLRYLVGLWYGKNEINRYFKRGEFGLATTSPTEFYGDTYNINKAVFGQATWEFLPKWTGVVGARFNQEDSGYHFQGSGNPSPLPWKSPFVGVNTFSSVGNKRTSTTGKASLQYQVTPSFMVYGMTSTGYKGVAYDITSSLSAVTAAQQPVKPEHARSYELGFKGNLLSNTLTFSGTLWHTRFSDYQQSSGSYIQDTTIYVTRLNSLDGVQTRGGEADVNWLANRDLLFTFAGAFTDATIITYKNASCYTVTPAGVIPSKLNASCILKNPLFNGNNTNDVSGGRMPFSPRRKFALSGKYDVRVPGWNYTPWVSLNATFQSDMITSLDQNPNNIVAAKNTLNAAFGVKEKSGRISATLNVQNLLNKQAKMNRNFNYASLNASAPNTPATVIIDSWTPLRSSFRSFAFRMDVKY